MHATVYTDGSSLGNPGPGGFCAIVGYKDEQSAQTQEIVVKGGDSHTTNNRMELSAVIAGLYVIQKRLPFIKKCTVYSDSSLIISTLTKRWKRKKNLDLWGKLDALIAQFEEITWQWVKGHATDKGNIRADKIAVQEAKKRKNTLKS